MLNFNGTYQEEGIKCECAICISLNITKPFLKLKKNVTVSLTDKQVVFS